MIWYILMAVFAAATIATLVTTIFAVTKYEYIGWEGLLAEVSWFLAIIGAGLGVLLSYRTAIGAERVIFDSLFEAFLFMLFIAIRYSMFIGNPDERKLRKTGVDQ